MGKCFLYGGGGSDPLNFNVVGGTTQPSNPKKNTIWLNTPTVITRWDISENEPQKVSGNKNLMLTTEKSTTSNGIVFTLNDDGSVTANGTATGLAVFNVWGERNSILLPTGTYTLSGCPSGGSNSSYSLCNNNTTFSDTGKGITFTLTEPTYISFKIRIAAGTKVSNIVFRPQLEKGSMATSFVKGDATGQVWISTGVSGFAEFNALKKNGIWVNPIFAKQYVSGSWVEKNAEIYHNGEWSELGSEAVYLLKHFEVNPDDFEFQNYEKGYGSWTITSEKINITGKLFSFQKKATVDLTRFNTVHFRINCNSTKAGTFHLCASKNSLMGNYLTDLSAPAMVAPAATGEQELTLDVSNLTGLYYIGGKTSYRNNEGGSTTMDIFDIWMD